MKGVGWSLSFLIAVFLTVGLADEGPSVLKNDNNKKKGGRSGAASEDADSAEAILSSLTQEAKEQSKASEGSKEQAGNQQSPSQSGRYQSQNEYGQKPSPNLQSANPRPTHGSPKLASSASKVSMTGPENPGQTSSRDGEVLLQHAISRLIPYNQHVFPHYSPGGNNAVVCTREGELHNVWSSNYQCMVCACISYSGLLRPVCASCAGCMAPGPDPYVTETPYTPVQPVTFPPPPEEKVSCKPLPIDQPFENPLHPCQVCVCTESISAYGKPDVRIRCQENPQCVLPPHSEIIHIVPDQPSTLCDEFPLNVKFPHPSDVCQSCSCSVQLSPYGQPEKVITCSENPDCTPDYPITTISPFWPPTTNRPGPLPGPSPHASCRPYVPNQPFEHPWDECQTCVCTEAMADNLVTVEISCFTKKSCCIEPPENLYPPVTAFPPYQPPQSQDQICQYRPYGVEFSHPSDQCVVCTCEVQGQRILPLCRVKNTPDCTLDFAYPGSSIGKSIQENTNSVPGSIIYNGGPSTPAQNNANSNSLPYPGSYGPEGLVIGSSQSSTGSNTQSSKQQKKPGNSQSGYGVDGQYGKNQLIGGYPNYNPVQYIVPGQGGYPQNYHPGSGVDSLKRFRPPGLIRNTPSEVILSQSHAQATASASASATHQNAYGYAPGYQAGGLAYPGLNKIRNQQLGQSVASAQASAKSSKAPKGRSGNPDNEATSKEN